MTIYAANRNFGTFGKEFPAIPNQRFTSPKFGGRAGGLVQGIATLGRFITTYRSPITKIGSAVAGSAIAGVALDETRNSFQKTYRAAKHYTGYNRHRVYNRAGKGYKYTNCRRPSRNYRRKCCKSHIC